MAHWPQLAPMESSASGTKMQEQSLRLVAPYLQYIAVHFYHYWCIPHFCSCIILDIRGHGAANYFMYIQLQWRCILLRRQLRLVKGIPLITSPHPQTTDPCTKDLVFPVLVLVVRLKHNTFHCRDTKPTIQWRKTTFSWDKSQKRWNHGQRNARLNWSSNYLAS
jgi:hypothetical protein